MTGKEKMLEARRYLQIEVVCDGATLMLEGERFKGIEIAAKQVADALDLYKVVSVSTYNAVTGVSVNIDDEIQVILTDQYVARYSDGHDRHPHWDDYLPKAQEQIDEVDEECRAQDEHEHSYRDPN